VHLHIVSDFAPPTAISNLLGPMTVAVSAAFNGQKQQFFGISVTTGDYGAAWNADAVER